MMYRNILVPVDLNHVDTLDKALTTAAALGKSFAASLTLFNVAGTGLGRPPELQAVYAAQLEEFAQRQSQKHGVKFLAESVFSDDPVAELSLRLRREIERCDYDLVVMATHVPGFSEYLFASQAGYLASHAKISVFVVRG
jgi:nucleotide-binding universal stress UspA family protein